MTLDELYKELLKQAESGTLQINEATTGTPGLDALITEALQIQEGTITVTATDPQKITLQAGVSVTAQGKTSFLNVVDMNTTLVFQEITEGGSTAIQFTMTTDLPSDWSLGKSFDTFRQFPIDKVILTEPHYVFSTWVHTITLDWYGSSVSMELIRGLNARAGTKLNAAFAVVAMLLDSVGGSISKNPYFWHGSISQSDTGEGPIANFRAELNIDIDLNFIALSNVFIGADLDFELIEEESDDGSASTPEYVQNQQLMFGGYVELGVAPALFSLDVVAMLSDNYRGLTIGVQPAVENTTSQDGILAVMGPTSSWNDIIPAWFRTEFLDLFGIKNISFYFTLKPTPSLLLTQTTVGTLKPLEIIPGKFSVYVDVTWAIYQPLAAMHQSISLYAELAVLTDFIFIIEIYLSPSNGDFSITGRYPGTLTFTLADLSNLLFSGALYDSANPKIPEDLASFSFSNFSLSFAITGAVKVWSFEAQADISFNFFNLFRLALNDVALSVVTTFSGGKTTYEGHISGQLVIERFNFYITAQVGSTIDTIFTIKFGNWTVGDFISYIMGVVTGDEDYSLPSPWNLLNTISLAGLGITINVTKGTWGITYALQRPVNLGFITINALSISYDSETKAVNLDIQGSFFGQPTTKMNLLDPTTIPQVPGGGDSAFELYFLAFGQRVSIDGLPLNASMSEIITAMRNAFKEQSPTKVPVGTKPVKGELVFNPNSNWMIAAQMRVISAIDISIIFNDPNLYGLLVSVSGEKLKKFTGLRFEILYRKITDTIGVYQMELRLPDAMRTIQFGAISFTIPVIGIAIYTNGNFKLDFGFPTNNDFTRSFTVQVFPFIGSGGFYFALLSEQTSTKLPVHNAACGTFNPVIEFGIGLNIGLGKSINAGILKAGLSLTFQGIVEGVFAFFNPDKTNNPNAKDDLYYWLKGTFAIVGKIYGEVNFAIIQANVSIEVYALVSITIEAYKPMVLYFEAGVRVSLTVRINLGLFKINIRLSFSAVIKESFTINMGSGTPPWLCSPQGLAAFKGGLPRLRSLNGRALAATPTMSWKPFEIPDGDKEDLTILFLPQITAAVVGGAVSSANQQALFATVLYLNTLSDGAQPGDDNDDFSKLAKAIFLWAIASLIDTGTAITSVQQVLDQTVTRQNLRDIFDWLAAAEPGEPPLTYPQIIKFLNSYFDITLKAQAEGDEVNVSVLPVIPDLTMTATLNKTVIKTIDFTTETKVDATYHSEIQAYFEKLAVRYRTELESRADASDEVLTMRKRSAVLEEDKESLATYIFRDFITILARANVQNAMDLLDSFNHSATTTDTLQGLSNDFGSTPALIASNNSAVSLGVTSLTVSGIVYQVESMQSFDSIAALFVSTTAADDFLRRLGTLNQDVPDLLVEGVSLAVGGGKSYPVEARDTLKSVADKNGTTPGDIVLLNRTLTTMLVALIPIDIPNFDKQLSEGDSFDSISNLYNAPIAALAVANSERPGIFATEKTITLPNLESIKVGVLVDKLEENFSFVNLGGMAGRYLLHGMRVPPPKGQISDTFSAEWSSAETYALFALTGQEFALPTLAATDIFTVELELPQPAVNSKRVLLNAKVASTKVEITLTPEQIADVNAIAETVLDPAVSVFRQMQIFRQKPSRYNLSNGLLWQNSAPVSLPNRAPDTKAFLQPTIWNFPASLTSAIGATKALLPLMQLFVGRQEQPNQPMVELPVQNYAWGVRVQVTVRQVPLANGTGDDPFTYEIIGTDDAGKNLLEDLLLYYYNGHSSIIHQVNILSNPNPAGATPSGLMADGVENISAFILKTNLSTVANPLTLAKAQFVDEIEVGNLINEQPAQSLLQIWEASVVRSGGFYLYYRVNSTNTGLPTSIFNENRDAVLTFVISLNITDKALPEFVNCAVVGDDTGEGGYVFAESARRDVSINLTSTTKLRSLLTDYRISLATLADLLAERALAQGVQLALNGVVFETDSNSWTLAMIAGKFSVSEDAIRALNPGVDFNNLTKWTALYIPPTTTTIASANITALSVADANRIAVAALLYANLDKAGIFTSGTITLPDQYTTINATIPAGNTAFELWRDNPDFQSGAVSLEARDSDHSLELLYNLLGYGVAANQGFIASVEALPISFDENDNSEQNIDARERPAQSVEDEYWKYHTVVPVSPFVKQLAAASAGAPDPALNPYVGVGSLFQIRAVWQDMFGNQTYTPFTDPQLPAAGTVLNNLPIDIGYFDGIIDLESWPAVNTGYRFGLATYQVGEVSVLTVVLMFDPANYLPGDDDTSAPYKDIAMADREVYRKLYYQLTSADTAITLASNISGSIESVDKSPVVSFVASIFDYLNTISQPEFAYTYYTTVEGDTLEHIAQQFGVSVSDLERLNPGVALVPAVGTRLVIPTVSLPPNIIVSVEEQLNNTASVFALSVVWTISREEQLVDGQFLGEPGIQRAATVLVPLTEKTERLEDDGGYYTLEQFARDFETAYPNTKIAVSSSDLNNPARDTIKNIWVVQFGANGIQYSIDKGNPLFFAPIPLANQLITGTNFTVYPYIQNTGIDFDHPMTKTFAGIDLDVWARAFLEVVDQFLTPMYAVPAFIVDQVLSTTYYKQVLDAKKTIAAAYGAAGNPLVQNLKVDQTGTEFEANRTVAAAAIEQSMLTTLTSAYTTTAIVQYNVAVTPRSGDVMTSLFGQPAAPTDPDGSLDEYSISTSRIALDKAKSYLTYMFTAKQPEDQRDFKLDLAFKINALEYDIHTVGPEFGEYKASSWLNFVVPLDPEPLGDAAIPIPLRAYPTPPSLVEQVSVPWNDSGNGTFADTRLWNYRYAYEPVSAAQDRIHTNIRFNVLSPQLRAKLAEELDLFEALAMFVNVYEALQVDMINTVAVITQASTQDQINAASAILKNFTFLVTTAANAWGSWFNARAKYMTAAVSERDLEYCVEEFANDKEQFQMNLTRLIDGQKVEFPRPMFDGYDTVEVLDEDKRKGFVFSNKENPQQYLTLSQADDLRTRTIQFEKLDIMATQNAWGGVFIVRNENLFDEEHACTSDVETNPNFLYRTPTVRFSNVITPLLDSSEPFNITKLASVTPPQPLVNWLQILFSAYFAGIPYTEQEPAKRLVRISGNYQYRLNPDPDGIGIEPFTIAVPMFLLPPFEFVIPTDWSTNCAEVESTVCQIASWVRDWFAANRPSTEEGCFVFDVATFSNLDGNQLPVYRLRQLYLLVKDVTDTR